MYFTDIMCVRRKVCCAVCFLLMLCLFVFRWTGSCLHTFGLDYYSKMFLRKKASWLKDISYSEPNWHWSSRWSGERRESTINPPWSLQCLNVWNEIDEILCYGHLFSVVGDEDNGTRHWWRKRSCTLLPYLVCTLPFQNSM